MHVREILRRPLMTEKTGIQADYWNQYSFEVDRRSNKHMVKDAVEACFDVTVENVRVINMPARIGTSRPQGRDQEAGLEKGNCDVEAWR